MFDIKLELLVFSHMLDHFFLQYRHVPQAVWNETTTLSPGLSDVTSGPMRSMIPLGPCQHSATPPVILYRRARSSHSGDR